MKNLYSPLYKIAALASFLVLAIATVSAAAEEPKPWSERITITGDFRYRHESIFREQTKDRIRHRLRLRAGLKAIVNPKMDAVLRVASGTGEPVSTNQDLGGGDGQKQIWIDRAFMNYHPRSYLQVNAGKSPIPFETTDLIWDPDLNLEGINLKLGDGKWGAGVSAAVAGYWISESSSRDDQGLLMAQLGKKINLSEHRSMSLSAAYSDYQNLMNGPVVGSARGNTVISNGTASFYVHDYNLWQTELRVKQTDGSRAYSIICEYVHNSAIKDNGFLAGFAIGAPKVKLPWEVSYSFRSLKRDANLGEFSDSDFAGGGSNANGHKFSLGLTPMKSTSCRATFFHNRLDPFSGGNNLLYQRLMLDAEVSF